MSRLSALDWSMRLPPGLGILMLSARCSNCGRRRPLIALQFDHCSECSCTDKVAGKRQKPLGRRKMRGKFDRSLQRRSNKAKTYKRPYGGKVLQRLFMYLDERNKAMRDEAVATLGIPQPVQRALGFVDKRRPKAARGAKSGIKSRRARTSG